MKNDAVFIDAFSTIHVGNGALLDNSYKLAKEYLHTDKIHVITADTETNKNRYENVLPDIFSMYPKTKSKKMIWSAWYILNCIACWIFISLKTPSKYWLVSKEFKATFKTIESSKYVISISGETLNDFFAPQMYMRCIMFYLCIKSGKKFCVFPQSIGPIFRNSSKKMLKFCLGNAEVIFARDKVSFELSKEIWSNCRAKIAYCPDVAVTQESTIAEDKEYFPDGRSLVGITLSNPPEEIPGGKNYVDMMISTISNSLDKSQHNILLMPSNFKKNDISDDYNTCEYAMNRFREAGFAANILPNDIIHPDTYQGIQKSLHLFISSRMHVGILATSAATPTIMLNTQHKIRGYMENIGMADFVVEYQGIESELPSLIHHCNQQNDLIREQLKIQNKSMRKQLADIFTTCFQAK
ncbi:polysaccharide pyruvyl transferase family protein [Pseudomonas vancouverensis]|uniref:polysaccharide pyruvyl transferase family protein n=1 Tax=Pseudomonas vancouverensis TaxID=95300 RepID=UPI003D004BDF